MKAKLTIDLLFNMKSDWLVTGATQQHIVDRTPMLDILGRPYLPASTIKGNVRHQFRKLSGLVDMESYDTYLFGDKGSEQGHLYFDDAELADPDYDVSQLTRERKRIALDRKNKVVRDQSLLMEEVAIVTLKLKSEITCYVKREDAEKIGALLVLSIFNMKRLGSGKSVGRGEVAFKYAGKIVDETDSVVQLTIDDRDIPFEEFESIVKEFFTE